MTFEWGGIVYKIFMEHVRYVEIDINFIKFYFDNQVILELEHELDRDFDKLLNDVKSQLNI